jgi:hypothetical protein
MALLPIVLYAVTVSARSGFRCIMAGVVLDTCCCPAASGGDSGGAPVSTVASDGCCRSDVSASRHDPSEISSRVGETTAREVAALPARACADPWPAARSIEMVVVRGGVPAPPLILSKQSLLI